MPIRVAYADLVPKCNTGELVLKLDVNGKPATDTSGKLTGEKVYQNPCDFNGLLDMINNTIDFLLFTIATPLIALILCYAGFLLITSGGNSESRSKAKKIIKNVIIGYIIALTAWLVVHTILKTLGFDPEKAFLKDQSNSSSLPVTTPQIPIPLPAPAPKPVADNGVLFIGGSYDEENPTEDTCANPPSKPLGATYDPFSYLGVKRVYAEEIDPEVVKKIAADFRVARCWIANWYLHRKISNPKIKDELLANASKMISIFNEVTFKIVDEKTDPIVGAVAYSNFQRDYFDRLFSNRGDPEIIIRYKKDWYDNGAYDVSLLIHELEHSINHNGLLIPKSEVSIIQKILPDAKLFNYMERFLTIYPSKINASALKNFEFFYCYMTLSQGLNNRCYYNETKDGKYKFVKNPQYTTTYTELTARLMQIRYDLGLKPEQDIIYDPYMGMLEPRPLFMITNHPHINEDEWCIYFKQCKDIKWNIPENMPVTQSFTTNNTLNHIMTLINFYYTPRTDYNCKLNENPKPREDPVTCIHRQSGESDTFLSWGTVDQALQSFRTFNFDILFKLLNETI